MAFDVVKQTEKWLAPNANVQALVEKTVADMLNVRDVLDKPESAASLVSQSAVCLDILKDKLRNNTKAINTMLHGHLLMVVTLVDLLPPNPGAALDSDGRLVGFHYNTIKHYRRDARHRHLIQEYMDSLEEGVLGSLVGFRRYYVAQRPKSDQSQPERITKKTQATGVGGVLFGEGWWDQRTTLDELQESLDCWQFSQRLDKQCIVAFRTFGWKTAARMADGLVYSLDMSFPKFSFFLEAGAGKLEEIVVGHQGIVGIDAAVPRHENIAGADGDVRLGAWLREFSGGKLLKIGSQQSGFECINLRGELADGD